MSLGGAAASPAPPSGYASDFALNSVICRCGLHFPQEKETIVFRLHFALNWCWTISFISEKNIIRPPVIGPLLPVIGHYCVLSEII